MESINFAKDFMVLDSKVHTMAHLPIEILRKIFQYFKIKEILQLSTVCHSWNNFISLPEYMDKVIIGNNGSRNPNWKEFKDMLVKSKRNYLHLGLASSEYILGDILSLDMFNWKSLYLYDYKIDKYFIKSVREQAPSLESLKLAFNEDTTAHELFSLIYPIMYIKSTYHYKSVMSLMGDANENESNRLNELTITAERFEKLLRCWNFKAPLKTFRMTYEENNRSHLCVKLAPLVEKLMKLNTNTLEEIHIECLDNSTLELIFKMKNLRNLTLAKVRGLIQTKKLKLQINPNIVCFKSQNHCNDIFYSTIFDACPNLMYLIVPQLSQSLMEMATRKLPNLTHLKAKSIIAVLPNECIKFQMLESVEFRIYKHPKCMKTQEMIQAKTKIQRYKWMLICISKLFDKSYDKLKK